LLVTMNVYNQNQILKFFTCRKANDDFTRGTFSHSLFGNQLSSDFR